MNLSLQEGYTLVEFLRNVDAGLYDNGDIVFPAGKYISKNLLTKLLYPGFCSEVNSWVSWANASVECGLRALVFDRLCSGTLHVEGIPFYQFLSDYNKPVSLEDML